MTTTERFFPAATAQAQRRALTKPTEPAKNHGWDNANNDLIMFTEDLLEPPGSTKRYIVSDALGQGTFGQVVKCYCPETQSHVAVKVIKNQDAYFQQARVEIGILKLLGDNYDTDRRNVVRLLEYFVFREHLCLVFELLDTNLYDLLKRNAYHGLSIQLVRFFVKQLLDALVTLRDERIIHCDLKPENILLKDQNSGSIKVIDFGSACLEHKTVYSYIQSRFYRSPEVVVGYPYNTAIDMWSLGCVAAELFLGLPLFPAASERDLLARVMEVLDSLPQYVIEKAKQNRKYFKVVDEGESTQRFEFLSEDEFEQRNNVRHPSGKRYFKHLKLADIIGAYPDRPGISDEDSIKEKELRLSFTDFLLGVLDVDPHSRWTPHQAALHPFVTGDTFRGPFQPPPAPEPRAKTNPVSIQIPNPKTHIHSASWHPDAKMPSFMNSPVHAQVQAQAHRAAMAVMQQFSPQVSPHMSSQHFHASLPVGGPDPLGQPSNPYTRGMQAGMDGMAGNMGDGRVGVPVQHAQSLTQSFCQGQGMGHVFGQGQSGMSPGTFGTPSTIYHSLGTNQMSQMNTPMMSEMNPMMSAAIAAAQAAVSSLHSQGGLSVPSGMVNQPVPSSHLNQEDGQQPGTFPIVGFNVSQPQAQGASWGSGVPMHSSQHIGSMASEAGNMLGAGLSNVKEESLEFQESLSLEGLSLEGAVHEAVELVQGSQIGASAVQGDQAGERLSETSASNLGDACNSDQDDLDLVLGTCEVYREPMNGHLPQSIQSSQQCDAQRRQGFSFLSNSLEMGGTDRLPPSQPTCYPTRTDMGVQGTVNHPLISSSSRQFRRSQSHSETSMGFQPLPGEDLQRRYSGPQAVTSTGGLSDPCPANELLQPTSGPSYSGGGWNSWGGNQLQAPPAHMDAGYVRRRSQMESLGGLAVLQENRPMGVRELSGPYIPDYSAASHQEHATNGNQLPGGSLTRPGQVVDGGLGCLSMNDARTQLQEFDSGGGGEGGFEHQDNSAAVPFFQPYPVHSKFSLQGARGQGLDPGFGPPQSQAVSSNSEGEMLPPRKQVMSRPRIP
ncbi:hypothetical protein BSKO_08039 [Bryopsis sp. KO-2023]|nr:hypothetical protein BSKO_08039 [Bryopsis sp. KO-2023]